MTRSDNKRQEGDGVALTLLPGGSVNLNTVAGKPGAVHLADFMAAYNFARRLKKLGGLTPYEYICKIWTSEPDRLILDPIHQMQGLNT